MKKYSKETVVGIFVVIGLLCIAYMTVKLGNETPIRFLRGLTR
jgi:phospholipid/cholesterol/gamma-HCH transport system substrate-binding protein